MALLTTLAVILVVWCAAGLATATLYAAVRTRHVRRQRARVPLRPRHGALPGRSDVLPRR
ncbi:hypothetical protein ACODT3_02575 [Streptomyces sp. 4.24]|uniref:hypothetical protein n=1 Tax=Streptomyces tritrimontium TaxID=3406573 RepID=UPI003BB495D4